RQQLPSRSPRISTPSSRAPSWRSDRTPRSARPRSLRTTAGNPRLPAHLGLSNVVGSRDRHSSEAPVTTEDLDAARLLLQRLGLRPEDLLSSTPARGQPAPTFDDYIRQLQAAVPAATLRASGPYWRRIV